MTGSAFLAYVKRKFKRTDKDTEIYEATTDTIADIRRYCRAEDFKEDAYINPIASLGDYRVSLPADFGHIIGDVIVTDSTNDQFEQILNKVSKQEYDRLYPDRVLGTANQTTGVPEIYCIYAGQIYFGPVPDSTDYRFQIGYTTEAYTEVDASTDPVPFADSNYRNILRAGVLAEMHDGLENYEEANYWKVIYIDGREQIKQNDTENIRDFQPVSYSGF